MLYTFKKGKQSIGYMKGEFIMASISKYRTKKGDFYRIQIYAGKDINGKRIVKTFRGFKTKREAKMAADKLSAEITSGNFLAKNNITFSQVYRTWFATYSIQLKESSISFIQLVFKNHILPFLGDTSIQKITVSQCQKMVNEWIKKELISSKKIALYTSKIFEMAISLEYITKNPMKKVVFTKVKKKSKNQNFYTRDELQKFLISAKKRCPFQIYVLFRLLAFSGLRKGEALVLTWNDIDFSSGKIKICKTLARGIKSRVFISSTKTESSERNIYVDRKTLDLLKEWKLMQRKKFFGIGFNTNTSKQLVFSNEKNSLLIHSTPNWWVKKVAEEAGIHEITPHGFRHTYATLAIQGGMNPKELQVQLGHADIRTTLQVYTSVTEEQKMSIPEKFTSLVNF